MEEKEKIVLGALSTREQKVEKLVLETKLRQVADEFLEKIEDFMNSPIPETEGDVVQELAKKSQEIRAEYEGKIQELMREYMEKQNKLSEITGRAFLNK